LDTFSEEALALVDRYFRSWQSHDLTLLKQVFTEDATYSINGKIRFNSASEIGEYWRRNSERQRRVNCSYKVTSSDLVLRTVSTAFLVRFYGVEEQALVSISGSGIFSLDGEGRCTGFAEHYMKETSSAVIGTLLARADGVMGYVTSAISRFFQGALGIGQRLLSVAYPTLLFAYLPLLLFSVYMNFLDATYGPIFSDPNNTDAANKVANASFAFGSVAIAARDWFKRSPNDLLRRKRIYRGTMLDLDVMCREMRNASNVLIYSGDFSFISRHSRLSEILYNLAGRGNLTLISYKDEDTVLRAARASTQHIEMIDQLVTAGKIRFEAPERAKYSLVTRPGGQAFLFRYEEDDESFVATLSATNAASRALVDTVLCLTRSLVPNV